MMLTWQELVQQQLYKGEGGSGILWEWHSLGERKGGGKVVMMVIWGRPEALVCTRPLDKTITVAAKCAPEYVQLLPNRGKGGS